MTQCQFLILVQDFGTVSSCKLLGDMSPWCVHHNVFFFYLILLYYPWLCLRERLHCLLYCGAIINLLSCCVQFYSRSICVIMKYRTNYVNEWQIALRDSTFACLAKRRFNKFAVTSTIIKIENLRNLRLVVICNCMQQFCQARHFHFSLSNFVVQRWTFASAFLNRLEEHLYEYTCCFPYDINAIAFEKHHSETMLIFN